jgi:hypothetical protein
VLLLAEVVVDDEVEGVERQKWGYLRERTVVCSADLVGRREMMMSSMPSGRLLMRSRLGTLAYLARPASACQQPLPPSLSALIRNPEISSHQLRGVVWMVAIINEASNIKIAKIKKVANIFMADMLNMDPLAQT